MCRDIDKVSAHSRWPLTTGVAQGRYYCIEMSPDWDTTSKRWKSRAGSMLCSPLTFTADENVKVLAFRLRLKLQVNAALPISSWTTLVPNSWNLVTLTSLVATTPVTIFLSEGSEANGEHGLNFVDRFSRSDASLFTLDWAMSLCCSLEAYMVSENCIARLYREDTGNDMVHTIRCSSFMSFHLDSPPEFA